MTVEIFEVMPRAEIEASLAEIMSQVVNVKYPPAPLVGCMGDGSTIDTANLSNIINSGYTDIFLPEGTYLIDWYIDLPAGAIKIYGVPGKTIIKSNGTSIYALFRLYKATTNYQDISIEGITFDGNNQPYTSGKGFGISIYADGGYSASRVKIQNNRFLNLPNDAFVLNASSDVTIEKNIFENCGIGTTNCQIVSVTGATNLIISKNKIKGTSSSGVGIATTSCNTVRVEQNYVDTTGNNGIQSLNDTDYKFIGNHSYNNTFNGCEIDGSQQFEVIGNTFKANHYHGLTITADGSSTQPADGEVVGNKSFNNQYVGFSLIGPKNVTLGNNRAFANNQANNASWQYGILIQKNTTKGISATDIVLTGNISQGDATQKYGLGILDDSDYVNVNGNNFRNNGGTGNVNNTSTGTHNLVANNS